MIQLDLAAHVRSAATCEHCLAHERFIVDIAAIGDADASAADTIGRLLYATLHVPASEGAWRAIVRSVATIVTNTRTRTRYGSHYERLRRFVAENADLL